MKLCTKCKELKPKGAFSKDRGRKDGLAPLCKDCNNERKRKWRKDNPQKVKEQDRRGRIAHPERKKEYQSRWCKNNSEKMYALQLKWKYDLTIENYNRMFEEQNGVCAICGETERVHTKLSVDHDHVTGKVRELVCSRCNSAMGFLDDNSVKALKLANYLKKYSK